MHVVADTGLWPHSPVRLYFKGMPRAVWVRQIKSPIAIPAVLPHGPPNRQQHMDEVAENQVIQHGGSIDEQFINLTKLTETHLLATMGIPQEEVATSHRREKGIGFKWTNVASPKAGETTRSTPVSRAWKATLAAQDSQGRQGGRTGASCDLEAAALPA